MSQSLVKNLVHLVYSTKLRRPWLALEFQDELFAYQAGIFKKYDCPALKIGGTEDHVHALFSLSKNHALKEIVEEVKKSQFEMAQKQSSPIVGFSMASRIRCFFGKPVQQRKRESVHRNTAGAPSQVDLPG